MSVPEAQALLEQIGALCDQYLALGEDTPMFEEISELRDAMNLAGEEGAEGGLEGLAPNPLGGQEPMGPEDALLSAMGQGAAPPQEEGPTAPEGGLPKTFDEADAAIKENLGRTGSYDGSAKTSGEEQPVDDTKRKRRLSRAKA